MITVDKKQVTIRVVNTAPEHVRTLAANQRVIYPTLTDDELFTVPKYLKHLALFPEGQFTALAVLPDGRELPVGSTSTYRTDFDFSDYHHTFLEAIAHGWLTNHDPQGDWLYGVDMAVHPDWRGMHIGRRLYEARRSLAVQLNLRGEIAGGMLPGYHYHHKHLTIAQYILRVKQGHLTDPTLTMQLKNGFKVRGILYEHITDPRSRNTAALIVRENQFYREPASV